MPTTTFLEPGTEATQDFTFFGNGTTLAGSGALTSATDQFRTGTRSLKSVVTVGSTDRAYATTGDGIAADAGTLISCAVRFNAVSLANAGAFLGVTQAANGSTVLNVGLDTTNKLVAGARNSTTGITKLGSTVLSAGTWYRVSLGYVLTTTTNWSLVVYLNGVSEISLSNADGTMSIQTTSDVSFGQGNGSGACGFPNWPANTLWIDDIYIDNRTDKTDAGDVHVTAKRPIANGTTNGFTVQLGSGGSGVGTGHSPQVNERPLSQTNGWSHNVSGVAITEEYNVETRSAGDVDLTGLTLYDWAGWLFSAANTSETAQIVVGGTTSNITIPTAPAFFIKAKGSTTYPAGSGTDIGVVTATTTTTVFLYECGVVVAYNPTPPTTFVPHQTYMVNVLTQ